VGTIPTPPTFTAGAVLTAAGLNTLRDVANFWALTPRAYVYRSAATSMANFTTTWSIITFEAEVYDIVQSGDTPMHDNATTPERTFIRTSGKYEISGAIEYAANATGIRSIMIRKNSAGSDTGGTLIATSTQGNAGASGPTSVPLPVVEEAFTAGDYLEVFGRQNSGGSLALGVGNHGVTFLRVKLSAS
jgi:hypothetical protein